MRVEITCSNRVGILQEIMVIFGEYRVNVTSGELGGDEGNKVYLDAPGLLTAQYQTIEKALSRVAGVQRVRRIELMPSERRHFELDTLLQHVVDEPVLSVNRTGQIIAANLAAARACGVSQSQLAGMQLQRFVPRLQLEALLAGYTVPRYGLPVTLRGKNYQLDWSPIALRENPQGPESLAGAVVTLEPVAEGKTPSDSAPVAPPVLWDSDRRRDACLRLQQLAPLSEPLLIVGERGAGKTTFAAAAHYLSPLANRCRAAWISDGKIRDGGISDGKAVTQSQRDATVSIVDDLDHWPQRAQLRWAAAMRQGAAGERVIATVSSVEKLAPALQQLFATLTVQLPPLRTMRPALGAFARNILTAADESLPLAQSAQAVLQGEDWPSNFIGLTDALMGAAAHARRRSSEEIAREDLPQLDAVSCPPWQAWGRGLNYREMMEKVERAMLLEFTREHPSTRELARRLGISHTAVANKLRKYGLSLKG